MKLTGLHTITQKPERKRNVARIVSEYEIN